MVQATLTLRKAIWIEQARVNVLNQALNEAAVELEEIIKAPIDQSTPTGRLYRLKTLTARKSARGIGNRRRGTKTRVVVGATFYRASSPGQPPAKRTGDLYRAIQARRRGSWSIRARVDKHYAKYLDDENILNRPFFRSRCREYFRTTFSPKVRNRIRELL